MALRFQREKDDEIDRAVKEERATPVLIFVLVLFAAIAGVGAWISGVSLASFGKDLIWLVGFGFVYWLFSPFYFEFRIRAKEIDGKVSAIEEAMNASKEAHAELLERLTAIEKKLNSNNAHMNETDPDSREIIQEIFPELRGIQAGLQHLNTVEREIRDRETLDRIREKDRQ